MASFLLSAMPFTGHVAPLCAVAEALVARGHDVRVYTGGAFRGPVEAAGARLVPWTAAPDFDEKDLPATFPRLVGKKGFRQMLVNVQEVFVNTVPAQFADLEAEWDRGPWDAVVGDDVSIGVAFHAEKHATPRATVSVLPLNLIGPQGPPGGSGLHPGRNAVTRMRDAALRAAVPLVSRPVSVPLATARAAVGLPPSRLPMDRIGYSPQLVTASGSALLDYDRTDRPASLHFVGRLRSAHASAASALPQWWGDLEGRRVIHVTQGTLNTVPTDLIRPAVEALADLDALVVVATGVPGSEELPFPVPANVRVGGFLPYPALLPRTDLIVTNGGWGGTLAALEHGIPLVIAGGDLDKPEVAARVAWAGAGVNLKTGTPSAAAVRAGVERVLADPSYREAAGRVAASLRGLGGAAQAAELIEELVPSRARER